MCGIFGYIGPKKNASELVLAGLKTLEYRGYDSWGVAVKIKNDLVVEKHIGKIGDGKLGSPLKDRNSSLALGHTRWATHGGVTVENAHPHLSCDGSIALVHNGIVENFQELKEKIKGKHKFKSETDTEVIAHLIEDRIKTKEFAEAVRSVFNELSGLNAIVVLSKEGEIVAAKNGSPLAFGVGDKEFFLASDTTAILPHTRKVIFIEDNQLIRISQDNYSIHVTSDGKKIVPKINKLNWKFTQASTGKFPHFMLKEIYEQPEVILNAVKNLESAAVSLSDYIGRARGTFFIASGTAYNACLAGTYLFSKIAKHHVNTAAASEFNYLEDFLTAKSLVIAFSQSGETIDVIEPLNRARVKKSKIAAVVNSLGSTIYRMADIKVLLGAGPEIAVASTKAYVAKLAFLLLTTYALVGEVEVGKKLLLQAADEVERLLKEENLKVIKEVSKILAKSEDIYTIGRGVSYPTALESALKMKEVSYIHTEGLAGGELKHGTIALIGEGTPCVVFAPADETYEAIVSNATEIKSRGGVIIGVGPKKAEAFDYWVEIKDIGEASLIPMVVPAQLLGYYLALERGLDPDKPRNLAKAVTVK